MMIVLEQFPEHLESLKRSDWERLFSLLPEIEKSKNFGEFCGPERIDANTVTMPYWKSSDIVDNTCKVLYELQLLPAFDWNSWKEGQAILSNENSDYSSLDKITLCKLLTTIIRADRFNDGYLISCFSDGVIVKIIKGLVFCQNS
jgi:hypothetical protein